MTEAEQHDRGAARPEGLRMFAGLVGVATLSGFLIAFVYQATLPIIKANKARALRDAVFQVIPGAEKVAAFRLETDGTLAPATEKDQKAVKFYAGYSRQAELQGVAIEAQGQGFQDVIKVLYGYDPEKQAVVGFRVMESKETPGLGDKIGADKDFMANFKALDVRLASGGDGLANAIQVVKKGAKEQPWQIDAITGATISSKAVGKMMNSNAQQRIPQVVRNLARLKEGP